MGQPHAHARFVKPLPITAAGLSSRGDITGAPLNPHYRRKIWRGSTPPKKRGILRDPEFARSGFCLGTQAGDRLFRHWRRAGAGSAKSCRRHEGAWPGPCVEELSWTFLKSSTSIEDASCQEKASCGCERRQSRSRQTIRLALTRLKARPVAKAGA